MRFRIPSVAVAMLVATVLNVIIFDQILLRASNPGLPQVLLAGVLGIAAGVAVLFLFDRYSNRRR